MEAVIQNRGHRYILGSREAIFRELMGFAAGNVGPNVLLLTGEFKASVNAALRDFLNRYWP